MKKQTLTKKQQAALLEIAKRQMVAVDYRDEEEDRDDSWMDEEEDYDDCEEDYDEEDY